MKKELRFVKSGMKMYYKNTLYAGKGGEIFNDNKRNYLDILFQQLEQEQEK